MVRSEVQCIHIDFNFKWAISIFILPFIFHQQIIFMYLRKDIHYVLIYLQEIKTHRDYQCILWNHHAITLIERCRLCVVGFMIMWIYTTLFCFIWLAPHVHSSCTFNARWVYSIAVNIHNSIGQSENEQKQLTTHAHSSSRTIIFYLFFFQFYRMLVRLYEISYVHEVHKSVTNVETCTFLSKIGIWMRKVKLCKTNGDKKRLKSRNSKNVSFYSKISYSIWMEHVLSGKSHFFALFYNFSLFLTIFRSFSQCFWSFLHFFVLLFVKFVFFSILFRKTRISVLLLPTISVVHLK